jgi:hypothetical protein
MAMAMAACEDRGGASRVDAGGTLPDPGVSEDGGVDAGPDPVEIAAPVPPDIPWLSEGAPPVALPVFTPCPSGWREAESEGVTVCEPWPETGWAGPCPIGDAHLPGRPGCEPLGGACDDGFPPDDDIDASVLRLRVDRDRGLSEGDGSVDAPFPSLAEALDAYEERGAEEVLVLLAAGAYAVDRDLPAGATIRGLCPGRSFLFPDADLADPWLISHQAPGRVRVERVAMDVGGGAGVRAIGGGARVELASVQMINVNTVALFADSAGEVTARGLTMGPIAPNPLFGGVGHCAQAARDGSVEVTDALCEGAVGIGFSGFGPGTTRLDNVAVFDTAALESGFGGAAVVMQSGAHCEVRNAVFERVAAGGVLLFGGSSCEVDQLLLRDVEEESASRDFGRGLTVGASSLLASRVRAERVTTAGLGGFASSDPDDETPVEITVRDLLISDVRPASGGRPGSGIVIDSRNVDTEVALDRILITGTANGGLNFFGAGVEVSMTDVRLAGVGIGRADFGYGMYCQDGARCGLERFDLDDARGVGLFAFGEGTLLELVDGRIARVRFERGEVFGTGYGVIVRRGAAAELRRVLVDRSEGLGVLAAERGSRLSMEDFVVSNTTSTDLPELAGRGIEVEFDASATLQRGVLSFNRDAALVGSQGRILARDLRIADTLPDAAGLRGHGVEVAPGGTLEVAVTLERVAVERSRSVGIFAALPSSEMRLTDVSVETTLSPPCLEAGGCPGHLPGLGLALTDGADVGGARVRIAGSQGCELFVAGEGYRLGVDALDLSGGDRPVCVPADEVNAPDAVSGRRTVPIIGEAPVVGPRSPGFGDEGDDD